MVLLRRDDFGQVERGHHLGNRLEAFLRRQFHRPEDGGLCLLADSRVQLPGRDERPCYAEDGLRRNLSRQQVIHRRPQGIDIRARREALRPFVVILLDGSEAFREREHRRARLLLFHVVAFADAEVDKPRVIVRVEQDVAGLDVEMDNLLFVYELEGLADLPDVFQHQLLGQHAFFLQFVFQRLPGDVFHDDIRRVVLLEHFQDIHNVRMMNVRQYLRLLDELLAELPKELFPRFRVHAHGLRLRVAVAIVFKEKLLDADRHLRVDSPQRALYFREPYAFVGYTEAALPYDLRELVFSLLK